MKKKLLIPKLMDEIISMVKSLDPGRVSQLQKKYKKKESSKKWLLINAILKGKVSSNEEGALLLFKRTPDSAFFHLKKRLKADILELVRMPASSKKNETTEFNFELAEVLCNDDLIKGKYLLSKGIAAEGLRILKRVSEISKKYELPYFKIVADDSIRTHLGLLYGLNTYSAYCAEINSYLTLLKAVMEAEEYGFTMILPSIHHPYPANADVAQIKDRFERLEKLFNETGFYNIGYWYLLYGMHYYALLRNYQKAYELAGRMNELQSGNPAMASHLKTVLYKLELARIFLHLRKYDEAATCCEMAMANGDSLRYLEPVYFLELQFHARFHNSKFLLAKSILGLALANPEVKKNEVFLARWHFFAAGLELRMGNSATCVQMLRSDTNLLKCRCEWSWGYRLLEIMALIELGGGDLAETKIECFRKHRNDYETSGRFPLILRILTSIVKHGFDFSQIPVTIAGELEELNREGNGLEWDPLSFELIRVDDWMIQKMVRNSHKSVMNFAT